MIATAVDSGIGGCLVFRHSWTMASAGLALAATLALGCARPIDLVNSDAPDSELAALVDSDAARRLLADVLARRSADARLPAASERPRLTDLASSEPQTGGAGESAQLPDQAFLKKLANRTSMDFSALVFARALAAERRSTASCRKARNARRMPCEARAPSRTRSSSRRRGSTRAIPRMAPTSPTSAGSSTRSACAIA